MTVAAESSTVWDANLYLKFADARMRPELDLMGRLDAANIVDNDVSSVPSLLLPIIPSTEEPGRSR